MSLCPIKLFGNVIKHFSKTSFRQRRRIFSRRIQKLFFPCLWIIFRPNDSVKMLLRLYFFFLIWLSQMVFRSQNILVFHNHSVFGLLDVLLGVIIIYPSPGRFAFCHLECLQRYRQVFGSPVMILLLVYLKRDGYEQLFSCSYNYWNRLI